MDEVFQLYEAVLDAVLEAVMENIRLTLLTPEFKFFLFCLICFFLAGFILKSKPAVDDDRSRKRAYRDQGSQTSA